MMKRERRLKMRCGRRQIGRRGGNTLNAIGQVPNLGCAPLPQQPEQTEPLRLGRPPRCHHLTPDTISEDPVTLNHQDVHALSRQRDRQRGASKPPANHNYVETDAASTAASLLRLLQTLQRPGSSRHPRSIQGTFPHTGACERVLTRDAEVPVEILRAFDSRRLHHRHESGPRGARAMTTRVGLRRTARANEPHRAEPGAACNYPPASGCGGRVRSVDSVDELCRWG